MKTKIVFFLSLLCAAAHGAALNDLTDVQRPFASSSSIGSLKWRLPAKYARIEGERLVVDIPESAYPADAVAVAEIPKALFDGADGFSFSVNVVANGIAKPSKPYLGLKCQIYSRGNPPYGERYSNGDADGLQGDFGETICSWVNFPDLRPDVVALNLGLQGTSGRAVFDLSSLRGGGTDGPFCRVKGIFRRVNDGKRVAYPERVSKDSRRRGVMLPGRVPTEDDFKTLSEWGVTLVRYQMVGAPRAKKDGADGLADFNSWLDVKLDVLEKTVLPLARKYGMKVTVDLHDAPGGRDNVRGMKILLGGKFTDAFVDAWRRIAKRFRGNEDVIYGYDLVNEPNQSRIAPVDYWTIQRMAAEAIREIDPETTIIIESNGWDVPSTFSYLSPLDLDNVIYQVHLYEPMDFTHQGIHDRPIGAAWPDEDKKRDRDFIRRTLAPVRDFERRHGAKIYVGEFSAATWATGAENYLRDCIAVFEEYGWDWTYHAFREYQGWSVEHESTGPSDIRPSSDNPRRRVLLDALRATR